MKGKREEMNSNSTNDSGLACKLEEAKKQFDEKFQQMKEEGLDDDFVKELEQKIVDLESLEMEVDKEYLYQLKRINLEKNKIGKSLNWFGLFLDEWDQDLEADINVIAKGLNSIYYDATKKLNLYKEKISQNGSLDVEEKELSGFMQSMEEKVNAVKKKIEKFLSGEELEEDELEDEDEVEDKNILGDVDIFEDKVVFDSLVRSWKEDTKKSLILNIFNDIVQYEKDSDIRKSLEKVPMQVFTDQFSNVLEEAKEKKLYDEYFWYNEFYFDNYKQDVREGFITLAASIDRLNWIRHVILSDTNVNSELYKEIESNSKLLKNRCKSLECFLKMHYIIKTAQMRTHLNDLAYLEKKNQNSPDYDENEESEIVEQLISLESDESRCTKQIDTINEMNKYLVEFGRKNEDIYNAIFNHIKQNGLNDDFINKMEKSVEEIKKSIIPYTKKIDEKEAMLFRLKKEFNYTEQKNRINLSNTSLLNNLQEKSKVRRNDQRNVARYQTDIYKKTVDIVITHLERKKEKASDGSKDIELSDLLRRKEESEKNIYRIIDSFPKEDKENKHEQELKTDEQNPRLSMSDLKWRFHNMIIGIDIDRPENTVIREMKDRLDRLMTESNEYFRCVDDILEETRMELSQSQYYNKNMKKRCFGIAEDITKLQMYTAGDLRIGMRIMEKVYEKGFDVFADPRFSVLSLMMKNYEDEARKLMRQIDKYRDFSGENNGAKRCAVDLGFPVKLGRLGEFDKATGRKDRQKDDISKEEPTDLGL